MSIRNVLPALTLGLLVAALSPGQGLVIPVEVDVRPLALRSHRVTVEIDEQAATTSVEQVFVNHTDRRLEAQYVFPIPRGAAISGFSMTVGGSEKPGQMVEAGEARRIYESIVRRAQDPGLIEDLGGQLFRARIFPIEPNSTQRIVVRYQHVSPAEGGLVHFVYPVRSRASGGPTVEADFRIDVSIESTRPVTNIYSPSHPVLVAHEGERRARVEFAAERTTIDHDFHLYYAVADADVGLGLVTHRPDPNRPGHFMMLVSPRSDLQEERIVDRDVVLVVDTSGSMAGEKIEQVRRALAHMIEALGDGDRFNIVAYSTDVDPWRSKLVGATEGRASALAFARTLVAQGGTDLSGALDTALSFRRPGSDRPFVVVFLTDGKPTLGRTTDPARILETVDAARAADGGDDIRIFTWGVGYDVDTHLLDAIAGRASGVSDYVRPHEDIAVAIASFFSKASHPVLSDLQLEVEGDVELANVYPRRLGDLHAGEQIVLIGRYTGAGDVAVRLTGKVGQRSESFTWEGAFAADESDHAFVESLWAQRRIGHLLDEIRLHGEREELVGDVIRLASQYGIQTPYTSYLVVEDGIDVPATTRPELARRNEADGLFAFRGRAGERLDRMAGGAAGARQSRESTEAESKAADEQRQLADSLEKGFAGRDGRESVDTSNYLRRLKETERLGRSAGVPFRRVEGRRYVHYRGLWVDDRFGEKVEVTSVRFASPAYFRLLELRPELARAFALGRAVLVVTGPGQAVVVGEEGVDEMEDAAIEALFR